MKTLIKKETFVSIYLFENDEFVDIQQDKIIIGNPLKFIVDDCNLQNSELVLNVSAPNDWIGTKYVYINSTWQPNPNYIEPDPDFPPKPPTE